MSILHFSLSKIYSDRFFSFNFRSGLCKLWTIPDCQFGSEINILNDKVEVCIRKNKELLDSTRMINNKIFNGTKVFIRSHWKCD